MNKSNLIKYIIYKLIIEVLLKENDERYRYLIKNGNIRLILNRGKVIFVELPQIPRIWILYRRPIERKFTQ